MSQTEVYLFQAKFCIPFVPNSTKKVRHFLLKFFYYIYVCVCVYSHILASEVHFSFSSFYMIKKKSDFPLYMSPLPLLNILGSLYITVSRSEAF